MATSKKFYAVIIGRKPGVYDAWYGPNGAEAQVKGFAKARFKGYRTRPEAEKAMEKGHTGPFRSKRRPVVKAPAVGRPEVRSAPRSPDTVIIYTDGGCLNNPGPGGYGVVIIEGEQRQELSGGEPATTNNRMELKACIVALEALEDGCSAILHSDSKYVVNGITKGWAKRWKAHGWMRTKTEPALNADLWGQLLDQCDRHHVQFVWVKGHAGIPENERCDQLANEATLAQAG